MDIQFVPDVYASAMYPVSYISKAQKGMSELFFSSGIIVINKTSSSDIKSYL